MPIMFNSYLAQIGLLPADVILLRHQDRNVAPDRTLYHLWRDNRPGFEIFQSTQDIHNRPKLYRAPVWASFVITPAGATMFAGMYAAQYIGLLAEDRPHPYAGGIISAGSCDNYDLQRDDRCADMEGKLFIQWGEGARAWVQRADQQNKPIIELRPVTEER